MYIDVNNRRRKVVSSKGDTSRYEVNVHPTGISSTDSTQMLPNTVKLWTVDKQYPEDNGVFEKYQEDEKSTSMS